MTSGTSDRRPASLDDDFAAWRSTNRADTRAAYTAFIRRYPLSIFVETARKRLRAADRERHLRRADFLNTRIDRPFKRMAWTLLSFEGRMGLAEFWLALLLYLPLAILVLETAAVFVIFIVLQIGLWPWPAPENADLFALMRGAVTPIDHGLNLLDGALALWFFAALCVKRGHDRGAPAGSLLRHAVLPVAGWLIVLLDAGFGAGQMRRNRYGTPPQAELSLAGVAQPMGLLLAMLAVLAFLALMDVEDHYRGRKDMAALGLALSCRL